MFLTVHPYTEAIAMNRQTFTAIRLAFRATVDALELIKSRANALALHLADVQDWRNP